MACSKTALSGSVNEFTFDVYKYIAGQKPSENAFMSTTSIMVVMTMLHIGARNKTETQMAKALRLGNIDKTALLSEIQRFVAVLKGGGKSVTLQTANKLFPHIQKLILKEYIETVSDKYNAEVKNMDYTTKAEESRTEINTWVENETNGKIKDLLPSGSINSLTAMVVVNAIYFKGNWHEQFDPSGTKNGNFCINSSEKVQVPMMEKEFENIKYIQHKQLACKAIEIPYVGEDLGMVLLLPDDIDGLSGLEKQLTSTLLQNVMSHMVKEKITVKIPKFKLEASYEMKDILKSLGMVDLFDDNLADLSGMGKDIFVSQVFHKAFVDVNEEGTEAAAATGAVMMLMCYIPPTTFVADHPFMFMIWDHRLNVPLFIGRVTNPKG